MVVLLYDNLMVSMLDELNKKYKKSSRGRITGRERVSDLIAVYKKPPLFNDGWLLVCEKKPKLTLLERLEKEAPQNKIIVTANSVATLNELAIEYGSVNPTIIDNHKVDHNQMVWWITSELGCDVFIAKAILKRTGGRIAETMRAVQTLSIVDVVSERDVYKYIKKVRNVSINDVVDWMLGVPRRGLVLSDIIYMIDDFRYAQSWLITTISKILNQYEHVFRAAMSGELTLINYKEFHENCSDKVIKKLSVFQVKRMLQRFGEVSLEYVVYLNEQVKKLSKRDRLDLYRLVQLVKLGGN